MLAPLGHSSVNVCEQTRMLLDVRFRMKVDDGRMFVPGRVHMVLCTLCLLQATEGPFCRSLFFVCLVLLGAWGAALFAGATWICSVVRSVFRIAMAGWHRLAGSERLSV